MSVNANNLAGAYIYVLTKVPLTSTVAAAGRQLAAAESSAVFPGRQQTDKMLDVGQSGSCWITKHACHFRMTFSFSPVKGGFTILGSCADVSPSVEE